MKQQEEEAREEEEAAEAAAPSGTKGSGGKRIMLSPGTGTSAVSSMRKYNTNQYHAQDPLLHITEEEKRARAQRLNALGSRHSRFGGTLVLRGNSDSVHSSGAAGGDSLLSSDTPIQKQFLWAHNLADPHQKQRRQNGGVVRGSNGIQRAMNIR